MQTAGCPLSVAFLSPPAMVVIVPTARCIFVASHVYGVEAPLYIAMQEYLEKMVKQSIQPSNGTYYCGQNNYRINSQNVELGSVTVKLSNVTVLSCVCHVCHAAYVCVSCVIFVSCVVLPQTSLRKTHKVPLRSNQ